GCCASRTPMFGSGRNGSLTKCARAFPPLTPQPPPRKGEGEKTRDAPAPSRILFRRDSGADAKAGGGGSCARVGRKAQSRRARGEGDQDVFVAAPHRRGDRAAAGQ